jgi:hypothetical protein
LITEQNWSTSCKRTINFTAVLEMKQNIQKTALNPAIDLPQVTVIANINSLRGGGAENNRHATKTY